MKFVFSVEVTTWRVHYFARGATAHVCCFARMNTFKNYVRLSFLQTEFSSTVRFTCCQRGCWTQNFSYSKVLKLVCACWQRGTTGLRTPGRCRKQRHQLAVRGPHPARDQIREIVNLLLATTSSFLLYSEKNFKKNRDSCLIFHFTYN
jgi:hypothetical protein